MTDVLQFLPIKDNQINFLWLSECSGFRHLELVTVTTGSHGDDDVMRYCDVRRKVLTSGEWVIQADQVSTCIYLVFTGNCSVFTDLGG